jgi:hypothetical protein
MWKIALAGATFAEMVLLIASPPESHNYAGANCSAEHPPPERKPGPRRTWTCVIDKKFFAKTTLTLILTAWEFKKPFL